jgi:hypothetical protein
MAFSGAPPIQARRKSRSASKSLLLTKTILGLDFDYNFD